MSSEDRRRNRDRTGDYLFFFVRPALSAGKPAITARSLSMLVVLSRATPARNSSLFLTAMPDFRNAFFTSARIRYSLSGIVKLSRTSFDFLILPLATLAA